MKACLSVEEREKMDVVDERLRLLREESDKVYQSKVNKIYLMTVLDLLISLVVELGG